MADILLQATGSEPSLATPVSELHARLTHIAGKRIAASAGWPKTRRYVRPGAAPHRTATALAWIVHHVRMPERRAIYNPAPGTCADYTAATHNPRPGTDLEPPPQVRVVPISQPTPLTADGSRGYKTRPELVVLYRLVSRHP